MSKLFTIGGTSVLAGVNTWRFATGKMNTRVGVLKRNGHTELDLQEVPLPGLLKEDWVAKLTADGFQAVMPGSSKKDVEAAPAAAVAAAPAPLTKEQKNAARNEARRQQRSADASAKAMLTTASTKIQADDQDMEAGAAIAAAALSDLASFWATGYKAVKEEEVFENHPE